MDETRLAAMELAVHELRGNYRPNVRSVRADGDTIVVRQIAGLDPLPKRVGDFDVREER